MIFAQPWWLLVFPAVLALALLARAAGARTRLRRLASLIASERLRDSLVPRPDRRVESAAFALFLGGCLCLAAALARPCLPKSQTAVQRLGVDVFVALDLSRSMLAEDMKPNRLEAAKAALTNFVDRLAGDRIALIAFAGEARVVAPLSFDGAALNLVLRHLDAESIGKGGTSLTAAIELAADKAREKKLDTCALIVVTDGEDHEGDPILTARQIAGRQKLRLFTAGVGTTAGAHIPNIQGRRRGRGNIKDRSGIEVVSKLDEAFLTKLAEAGGGRYVRLGAGSAGLRSLLETDLRELARSTRGRTLAERVEVFQFPLAAALVLLAAAAAMPQRRAAALTPRGTVAAALLACAPCLAPAPARAGEISWDAEALVRAGKAAEAFDLLRDEMLRHPDDPRLLYNYALAAYAGNNFGIARTAWGQLAEGPDPRLRARCLFQLGNIEFKEGLAMAGGDTALRIAQFERAREYYLLAQAARAGSANEQNLRTAAAEIIRLHMDSARGRIQGAERILQKPDASQGALRSCVEQLEAAIASLEAVLAIEPRHAEAQTLLQKARELLELARLRLARAAKSDLEKRMEKAKPQSPEKNPLGDEKKERELDREAEQLAAEHQKVADQYALAMAAPRPDPAAERERQQVRQSAAKVLSENSDRHIQAAGRSDKAPPKIDQLTRARDRLRSAMDFTPEDRPLQEKAAAVDRELEALIQQRARDALAAAEKEKRPDPVMGELRASRENLNLAAEIDPKDKETPKLASDVDAALARVHEMRGDAELDNARKKATETPVQAIAHAEQAAGDYSRAQRLNPSRSPDIAPKRAEALQTADRLRAELARQAAAQQQPPPESAGKKPLEIPDDLRDMALQSPTRNGRDRQKAAILDTKDAPVLRDW